MNGMHGQRSEDEIKGISLIKYNDPRHLSPGMDRLRVVPRDRAFYMLNPPHEEQMRIFNDLIQKYISLPIIPKESFQAPTLLPLEEYATNHGGHRLKPSQYLAFRRLALRLAQIDHQLMPEEVNAALQPFLRRNNAEVSLKKYKTLDSEGRAVAVGRRKTSSARVQVVKSQENIRGQILVNGRPLDRYFLRLQDRNEIMYPLRVIEGLSEYNVFATVQGGGSSGQAGAISHALSRSLVIHNPLLLTRLSKAGCIQRDPRSKERKKPGKPRARKSYTWVKR
jgi:small subunit ribosomal protein S9